jgi:uncharacterized protein with HEPN domain
MSRRDPRSWLTDIAESTERITELADGLTLQAYSANFEKRSAIERQLMICGEATSQLRKAHPELAERITHADRIVVFRNILVHGYYIVRDEIVWEIIQLHIPVLRTDTLTLLQELGADTGS